MKYRTLGKRNMEVSVLGFGAMRLPLINGTATINEKETEEMIHFAIEHGINYFDTAYPYHDGNSEIVLGKLLKKGKLRNKVMLADKMPCWLIESYTDFDRYLDEQLQRLQTDHIEFYLAHALFSERWDKINEQGILKWSEKAIKEGKIGSFGFSVHDSFPVFKKIVDAYDKWSFCQIQYNYLNENVQVGTEGMKYARDKGLDIIVMEPLLGGMLANPLAEVKEIFERYKKNPVDIALRWLWDKPEISLVLSGMSSMKQLKENIEIAENSGIGAMTDEEHGIIKEIKEKFEEYNPIPCTKCRYCMPCPSGVDIPRNLEIYSEGLMHRNMEINKPMYNFHVPDVNKANACIECGICETKCPQSIKISGWMPKIHAALAFKN
jgi:predicted aldo/keto reductase-like oxidoreductase